MVNKIDAAGGEDVVLDMVADGKSFEQIAKHFDVNRRFVWEWIREDAERHAAFKAARSAAAPAKEEQGAQILDDAAQDPDISGPQVQIAIARSKYRQWQAGIYDREIYQDQQQASGPINIAELHLYALQHATQGTLSSIPTAQLRALPTAQVVGKEEEGG